VIPEIILILCDFYTFLVKIHGHRGPKRRARALGRLGSKLGPMGPGPALGPPVAMYFHKKGIEIT